MIKAAIPRSPVEICDLEETCTSQEVVNDIKGYLKRDIQLSQCKLFRKHKNMVVLHVPDEQVSALVKVGKVKVSFMKSRGSRSTPVLKMSGIRHLTKDVKGALTTCIKIARKSVKANK